MISRTADQPAPDLLERRNWLWRARGRLLGVMRRIEALPAASAGALLVGQSEHPEGMILVERNRICWAAAIGMRRRLHDILRSHSNLPLGDEQLEALYARCRNEHRPLGEALVAEGLVAPEQVRAALKQHTVESLLALDAASDRGAVSELPMTWVERGSQGYNPRYTFTAAEVLAAVGSQLLDDTSAELIDAHLHGLTGVGCAIIAFSAEADGAPVFVGAQTVVWLPLEDLLELAAWARAALEASPGFSPAVAHAFARSADGGTVTWLYEGATCAAICPTGPALQRLVAALGNQSLAMVLATRHTVLQRVRQRAAIASE